MVLASIDHIAGYDPKYGSRSFLININPNDVKNSGKKISKKNFEKMMIKNRVCLHFFWNYFFQPMAVSDSVGLVLSSWGAPLQFQKNLDLPGGLFYTINKFFLLLNLCLTIYCEYTLPGFNSYKFQCSNKLSDKYLKYFSPIFS